MLFLQSCLFDLSESSWLLRSPVWSPFEAPFINTEKDFQTPIKSLYNESVLFKTNVITVTNLALNRLQNKKCLYYAANIGQKGKLSNVIFVLDVTLKKDPKCEQIEIALFGTNLGTLQNVTVVGSVKGYSENATIYSYAINNYGAIENIEYVPEVENAVKAVKNGVEPVIPTQKLDLTTFKTAIVIIGEITTLKQATIYYNSLNDELEDKRIELYIATQVRTYNEIVEMSRGAEIVFYSKNEWKFTAENATHVIFYKIGSAMVLNEYGFIIKCTGAEKLDFDGDNSKCALSKIEKKAVGTNLFVLNCPFDQNSDESYCFATLTQAVSGTSIKAGNTLKNCTGNELALEHVSEKCVSTQECKDAGKYQFKKGCFSECPEGSVVNEEGRTCTEPTLETDCPGQLLVLISKDSNSPFTNFCAKECPSTFFKTGNSCVAECPNDQIGELGQCYALPHECGAIKDADKNFSTQFFREEKECSNLCKQGKYADDKQECVSLSEKITSIYIHLKTSIQKCLTNYDGGLLWKRGDKKCTDKCEYYNKTEKVCENTTDEENCKYFYLDLVDTKKYCVQACPPEYQYLIENTKQCVQTCFGQLEALYHDEVHKTCNKSCLHYNDIKNETHQVCTNTESCKDHEFYKYSVPNDLVDQKYVCALNCPDGANKFVTDSLTLRCGKCDPPSTYSATPNVVLEKSYDILVCVPCDSTFFQDTDPTFSSEIKRCEKDCTDFPNPPGQLAIKYENGTLKCTDKSPEVNDIEKCPAKYLYNKETKSLFKCIVTEAEKCLYIKNGDLWEYQKTCDVTNELISEGCYTECTTECKEGWKQTPDYICVDDCELPHPYIQETDKKLFCTATCSKYLSKDNKNCVTSCDPKIYEIETTYKNKQCTANCDDKYYINQPEEYIQCLPTNCDAEKTFNIFDETTKECLSTCSKYLYTEVNGTKHCYDNCSKYDYRIDEVNKKCSQTCKFYEESDIKHCVAENCPENYPFLDTILSQCVSTCPSTYYVNQTTNTCENCSKITLDPTLKIYVCIGSCDNLQIDGTPVECVDVCPENGLYFDKKCDKTLCCGQIDCKTHPMVVDKTQECIDNCPLDHPYAVSTDNNTCVSSCPNSSIKLINGVLRCVPFDNTSCLYYQNETDKIQCYDTKCPSDTYAFETPSGQIECKLDDKCDGYWNGIICVTSCASKNLLWQIDENETRICTNCKSNQHYIENKGEKECVASTHPDCPYQQPTNIIVETSKIVYQKCVKTCNAVDYKNQTKCIESDCQNVHVIKPDSVKICYENCGQAGSFKFQNGSQCTESCVAFATPIENAVYNCTESCSTNYFNITTDPLKMCLENCKDEPYQHNTTANKFECIRQCTTGIQIGKECVTSCPYLEFAYNGGCVTSCPINQSFVNDKEECVATCDNNMYEENKSVKECVDECKDKKTIINIITGVIQCIADCKPGMITINGNQCIEPIQCHDVIVEDKCEKQCPPGQVLVSGISNICATVDSCAGVIAEIDGKQVCTTSCPNGKPIVIGKTCSDVTQCTSDTIDHNNVCSSKQECSPGDVWYEIEINGQKVKKCDKQCPSFAPKLIGSHCLPLISCGDMFVLNYECVAQCPVYVSDRTCVSSCVEGQYLNQTENSCKYECSSGIYIYNISTNTKICQEPNSCPFYEQPDGNGMHVCTDFCNSTNPFIQGNKCQNTCPSGKYQVNKENGQYICQETCPDKQLYMPETGLYQCITDCNGYYEIDATACTQSCKSANQFVYQGKCLTKCPENNEYMQIDKGQIVCSPKCGSSTSFVESLANLTCIACVENNEIHYSYNENNIRICHKNCDSFSSGTIEATSPITITQCHNTPESCTHLIVSTGVCADSCDDVELIVTEKFSRCIEKCDFYLNQESKCVLTCPNNKYEIQANGMACKDCDSFDDVNGAKQCRECEKKKESGECVDNCISNDLIWDATIKQCVQKCPSQNQYVNVTLQNNRPIEQSCVSKCESGFSNDQNVCIEAYQCPYYKVVNGRNICGKCLDTDIQIRQENNTLCATQCDPQNSYYNQDERLCQPECDQFVQKHPGLPGITHEYCILQCNAVQQQNYYYIENGKRFCVPECSAPHSLAILDEFQFMRCDAACPTETPFYDQAKLSCAVECTFYKGENDNFTSTCVESCENVYLFIDGKQTCFDSCPEEFERSGQQCIDSLKSNNTTMIIIIVVCVLVALAVAGGVAGYYVQKRRKAGLRKGRRKDNENTDYYAKRLNQQVKRGEENLQKGDQKTIPRQQTKAPVRRTPVLPGQSAVTPGNNRQPQLPSPRRRGRIVD